MAEGRIYDTHDKTQGVVNNGDTVSIVAHPDNKPAKPAQPAVVPVPAVEPAEVHVDPVVPPEPAAPEVPVEPKPAPKPHHWWSQEEHHA